MSGIYIPSMEMPTRCYNCKIDCGLVSHIDRNIHPFWRSEKCPLIPVPDHGRLIDGDSLEYEEAYLNGHYELGVVEIVTREDIESAPTIIPADKESDT